MARYAIQAHPPLIKQRLDLACRAEAVVALEHVVGRLNAISASGFGIIKEGFERLGSVLSPLNACMKTGFGHN
jgi:hypothetical protein